MEEVSRCNNNNSVLHYTDTWNTPLLWDRSGANSQSLHPTSSELEATWHSHCTYSSFMVSLASLPLSYRSDVTKNKYDRTITLWCYRTINITLFNKWIPHNALYLRKTIFSFVSTVTVESKYHYFITKTIHLVFTKVLYSHICAILNFSNIGVLWYMSSVLHPGSNDPTEQNRDGDLVILKAIWDRQNNNPISSTSLSFIAWLLPSIT